MKNFAQFGIRIPEILLPAKTELSAWSVIACDQYTQDAAYWQKAAAAAAGSPSTLNLILPEIYLKSPDKAERIAKIRSTMNEYLAQNVFAPAQSECLYIERKTGYGRVRHGLVCAIDLETYEWKPMSKALIRATEATIVDRIPPRMEIRRGAALETPHIMLLVNDPAHALVEGTGDFVKKETKTPVYDGDLMLNAGHITGWAVRSDKALDIMYKALETLKKANTAKDGSVFMFAVGDGNHSLATAKAVWDEYKAAQIKAGASEADLAEHPARFALVEIVNIYDTGLTFEPIHRVLFNAEPDMLIAYTQARLGGEVSICTDAAELESAVTESAKGASFGFVFTDSGNKQHYECLHTPVTELAVSRLQPVFDDFIAAQNGLAAKANEGGSEDAEGAAKSISIDYIHGSEEVLRLGRQPETVGVLLPPIAKDSFFATINSRGPLPRKSFSMGEADEKRFYLECRRLFG